MNFQQFLSATCDNNPRPRLRCRDGFSVSVQASEKHYCNPKATLDYLKQSEYVEFELEFPSDKEPDIAEYAMDKESLTNTYYPCVPISVVERMIKKHGGIHTGSVHHS